MAEQEEMFETAEVVAAEDGLDSIFEQKSSVVSFIKERYKRAEDARYADERRWLRAYRNYRGLYGADVKFTDAEKSRIFVKVTKTKTLAAYGQIVDVLFGNNNFPLTVNPSILPDGVAESVHINIDPNADQAGDELRAVTRDEAPSPYLIDGVTELRPGETLKDYLDRQPDSYFKRISAKNGGVIDLAKYRKSKEPKVKKLNLAQGDFDKAVADVQSESDRDLIKRLLRMSGINVGSD